MMAKITDDKTNIRLMLVADAENFSRNGCRQGNERVNEL